jgi:hypothetical protein
MTREEHMRHEGRDVSRRLTPLIAVVALVLRSSTASSADTTASFTLRSGVAVRIVEAPFNASQFKIQSCSDQEPACLINGRVPFGNAFELPETYVKSITVSCKGRSYSLDATQMYDAWGSRPLEVKGVIRYFGGSCSDAKNGRFRGTFSDAAGSFVAEWLIVNGVSIRTVLTDSSDVGDLFMKSIDPPEYEE